MPSSNHIFLHSVSIIMAHPLDHGASAAWSVPLPPPDAEVPDGLPGLQALALQGRWREVAQRCRAMTATATAAALSVATYHILALLKLKMNEEAASEMGKLGSLEDSAYRGSRAQGSVPLAPFALRCLRAELPWRLGRQQEAVDRLYALLHWCAEQHAASVPQSNSSEEQAATAAASGLPAGAAAEGGATAPAPSSSSSWQQLWRHRRRWVLLALVNKHCRLRQHKPALALLNQLLLQDEADAEAWQQAGLVQLMLGDLPAAQQSLRRAEQLLLSAASSDGDSGGGGGAGQEVPGQLSQQQRQALIHRNRGLLSFVLHDYRGTVRELDAALSAAGQADATAANNRALALMYSCHLPEAMASLEQAFMQAPEAMMLEDVVTNLASMYELGASAGSLDAKRRMATWVAAAAPDDFDLACTKTVGA